MTTDLTPLRAPVSKAEIDAVLISGLYRRTRPLLIANLGALTLLSLSLWHSADRFYVLLWAFTLAGWTMVRFGLARAYLRRPRATGEARYWTYAFAVGSGIAGTLWGSSLFLIESLDPESARLVTAFLMAALSAAAIAGYTNSMLAFGAFLTPSLLPFGIRLIWVDGSPHLLIAGFVLFWAWLVWSMGSHLNHGFKDGIGLVLQNQALAERLARAKDKAEAASLAKTRFLSNMSHELRTPLNAIVGYSEVMAGAIFGPLGNPTYESYARDIFSSGRHLLGLVEKVLDVSSIEAGKFDLSEDRVDIGELVRGAVDHVRETAQEDNILIHVDVRADLPNLRGDATKLQQIFLNLLSNAVKFTPPGGQVMIAADLHPDRSISIAVADTGIGIAQEDLERVLTPFGQLQEQDHLRRVVPMKDQGGHTTAGLGLPLAKLLTELHGGDFILESRVGHGTTATVSLPPERTLPLFDPTPGIRVLAAE
jgi:two-component system cell cycle sensor histidine kinase PleC